MLSHVTIGTADLARAKAFYDALIGALGIGCIVHEPEHRLVGYAEAPESTPQVYLTIPIDGWPASVGNGQTFAFLAKDRAAVRALLRGGVGRGRYQRGPARPQAALSPGLLRRLHA